VYGTPCPLTPYAVDYEFILLDGGGMNIVCGVAQNLRTGQTWRRWRDEMGSAPFFDCGPDAVLVAYNAQADWNPIEQWDGRFLKTSSASSLSTCLIPTALMYRMDPRDAVVC
jgi:hypothetical protein